MTARLEDLPCQERGRRVGDRVVRVDHVQLELARDLHEPVGERQQVLRLAKQRVARRGDLMERQARVKLTEPERRVSADEVNLVAAVRERFRQLGGNDAAAPDRGVAENPDVQSGSLI